MNFDFNDDQQEIKRTARELLAARFKPEELRRLADDQERGFSDEHWTELVELGWPGIFVPEEDGGQGLGVVDLVILQEELGYALAPTPFFSNAAAGLVLRAAAQGEQRERWLRPLAAGEKRGTFASEGEGPVEASDGRISARRILVPDAHAADFVVVQGGDEHGPHYVVATDAEGVSVEPTEGIDTTRRLFEVTLDSAPAERLEGDAAPAHPQIATALAAESVGVAQRAMEMAVEHAKERKQFGVPIGVFQAVSHRCAQMLLEVEGARSVVYYAGWACDHEPKTAPLAAAMAKSYASDAGWRVTASSLQVHGGIGFTWEHDLHFFLKRAKANAHALGTAREHRARVADLAGI